MSAELSQIAELIATGNDGRMYATEPEKLRRLLELVLARESGLSQPDLRQVGVGLIAVGEYPRAQRILDRALSRADSPRQSVAALINLADAHRYAGDLAGAEPKYTEAIEQARTACPDLLHFALQHYGKHLLDARRPKRAAEVLEQVLKMRRRLGDNALTASTREALNLARAATGRRAV
ncbi:tetratricopeptide repeat protein [Glycomyces xiaoerkulensis]|uniref:tetratricopeptide repeat protein n=1 Tax=Glycomyces xiaoerkulensis TaxID=2038139 RepID=UPI000C25F67D|nr:tetratricopeptide repeat protein [Glycomyces xiaoerkulensis]